jgi:hypothetical protein
MLQTHFLRRYPTKPNTTLESKAAFVHLNCIVHLLRFVDEHAIRVNESIAFLTLTVNNYEFKEKIVTTHFFNLYNYKN